MTQSSGGNATTPRPTGGHQHPHNQTTNGTSASSTSVSPILTSLSSTTGCALSLVTETTTVDIITTVYLPLNDNTTTSCDYCNTTTATSVWHNSTSAVADPIVGTTGMPHSYNITRGHWIATETECEDSVATSMTSLSSDSVELTASEYDDETTTMMPSSEGSASTTTASTDTTTTASAEDVTDAYTYTLTVTTSPTSTVSLDSILSSTGESTLPATDDHSQVTTATATTTADSGGDTAATTTYVIDTTVMPITTASVAQTLATTLTPTRTLCATDAPAGETPRPRNVYCGVHGVDVGNYFLAQYVNNKAYEPVTLEGCWQFCKVNNPSSSSPDPVFVHRCFFKKHNESTIIKAAANRKPSTKRQATRAPAAAALTTFTWSRVSAYRAATCMAAPSHMRCGPSITTSRTGGSTSTAAARRRRGGRLVTTTGTTTTTCPPLGWQLI